MKLNVERRGYNIYSVDDGGLELFYRAQQPYRLASWRGGAMAGGGGDAGDAAAAHNGRSLCITHLTLGAPYITVCAGPARQAAAVAAAEATTRPRICIQQHTMAPSVFFQLEIYYRTNVRRARLPSLFSRLVSRQNPPPPEPPIIL